MQWVVNFRLGVVEIVLLFFFSFTSFDVLREQGYYRAVRKGRGGRVTHGARGAGGPAGGGSGGAGGGGGGGAGGDTAGDARVPRGVPQGIPLGDPPGGSPRAT